MKRNMCDHSHHDENRRSSRNENCETGLRKKEEERLRRRREWMVEQQKLREHEKLKEKKILEYEIRRALEKGLPVPRERSLHRSRSNSKSKSMENQQTVILNTSNISILSKKSEPSDGTMSLFKEPEGTTPLFKGPEGTTPLFKGPEGTTPLFKGPEGTTPLFKGPEGTTPLFKGPEGTTPLFKGPEGTTPLFKGPEGTTPLFKGPEGTQLSAAELRRIKVDIRRNVPDKVTADGLQRDIINPEDILVKRREGIHQQSKGPKGTLICAVKLRRIKWLLAKMCQIKVITNNLQQGIMYLEDVAVRRGWGEGSKPIFEREEIKGIAAKAEEIVECRTVVDLNNEDLESQLKMSRNTFFTSSRDQSPSPQHRSSPPARYEDSQYDYSASYRSDRERNYGKGRSREYKETVRRRGQLHAIKEEHLHKRKSYRGRSRLRDRQQRGRIRDSYYRSSRDGRSYPERSRERFRERRERNRTREHRISTSHYIERIPVPIYYGDFPPRPIMVGPLVPIRSQVPALGGTRHIMGPSRPFPPRFIPPNTYGLRSPLNPTFRPIY